jgi:Leucine-rich repeat (LRR) protein
MDINQIISKEKQNRTGVLDLSSQGKYELTLPIEIRELTWLKKLYLKNNPSSFWTLSFDYQHIKELINLEVLDMSNCHVFGKFDIRKLTKLKHLDISDNTLFDDYDNLPTSIEFLDISSTGSLFSSHISRLKNLKTLIMDNVSCRSYDFLRDLNNLTRLSLSNNELSDISIINHLPNLVALSLAHNQICDLNQIKFEKFRNLEFLSLQCNHIVDITPLKPILENTGIDVYIEYPNDNNKNKIIYIEDNPITSPPISIVKQGKISILNWIYEESKDSKPVLEKSCVKCYKRFNDDTSNYCSDCGGLIRKINFCYKCEKIVFTKFCTVCGSNIHILPN